MALRRPPQHSADAEPVYVLPGDDAWDHKRIAADRAAMEERGEDPASHPFALYAGGVTRFDLDARLKYGNGEAKARDWLDFPKACTFSLRRLTPRQFARIHARKEVEWAGGPKDYEAALDACQYGLAACGGPGAPKLLGRGELTESDLETLVREYGHGVVWAIGDAIYHASIPLTDDEKKAFAS